VLIEYHLTDRGRDLTKVMEELAAWAERWSGAAPVGASST
jgi:DNA-binding HxlR family transcriptional regulator